MAEHTPHSTNENVGHEASDANVKILLVTGGGIAILVVFSFLLTRWIFAALDHDIDAHRTSTQHSLVASTSTIPPEPRLQLGAADEVRAMRAQEEKQLSSYGWVDEAAGVAHIPISRAMELYLAQTPAARTAAAVEPVAPTNAPVPAVSHGDHH